MGQMRSLLLLAAFSAAGPLLAAQSATVVFDVSGGIPGVGNTIGSPTYVVTDDGDWIALYDTDHPDEDRDCVLIRNGTVDLREGHALLFPAGASIDEFGSLNLDRSGRTAWGLKLAGPGTNADSGLYLNTQLVLQEGSSIAGIGVPLGTSLDEMGTGSALRNSSGTVLMAVSLDDPTVPLPPPFTRGILRVHTDPLTGGVQSIEALARYKASSGNIFFNDIEMGDSAARTTKLDLNEAGDYLFSARIFTNGIGATAVLYNDQILFQEAEQGPLPDTTWQNLMGVNLDLNDSGNFAVLASIRDNSTSSNRTFIVTEDGPAIESLIPYAPTAPYIPVVSPDAPVRISNQGDVFCFMDWQGLLTVPNGGIRVNDELPVHAGITELDGLPIQFLGEDFEVSPSGRYLLFNAGNGNATGMAMMDLGMVEPLDDCSGNPADLRRASGFPTSGETVTLAMNGGQAIGALSYIVVTENTVPGYPPCGVPLGTRELVIDLFSNPPLLVAQGAPWIGPPVEIDIPVSANPLLVDQTFYAQGLFVGPGPSVFLTNAVALTVGGP